jgi:hypothetical protein
MSYVYVQSEKPTPDSPFSLWTVGHYDPEGNWHAESDHEVAEEAAQRVAWLNGEGANKNRADHLYAALTRMLRMHDALMAECNLADSALSGETIFELNSAPDHARRALGVSTGDQVED